MVYVAAISTIVVGFASLAVDYGRVQLAKEELRRGADAAAHAGALRLGSWTTARDAAAAIASGNNIDGTAMTLDTSGAAGVNDILFGTWDDVNRTFTKLTGSNQNYANAIQINSYRDVNLYFARVMGVSTCRVRASSTACQLPTVYGLVGLNYIKMGGNASDSYWSTSGAGSGNSGNIGSNGDITLSGSSSIHGNAHPGIGKSVIGASNVYGSTTPLTTALSYANGSAAPYSSSNNDNALLDPTIVSANSIDAKNKTANIPAGHYFLQDFSQGAGGSLTLLGPVTFYVYGSVSIGGSATVASNLPKNLTIVMVPNPTTGAAPGSISITSNSALYATIYAPQSALTMSGNGDLYGSVVAKSIDMTGSSAIHYDVALSGNKSTISLVK
jgi:Flp pilus assembly protein TadG